MNPLSTASAPPAPMPTPLAALPVPIVAPEALLEHRGVRTAAFFDGFEAETEALFYGASVHDLGWLRQVCIKGSDGTRWLNGMVTNAVQTLKPDEGNYNFLLNAQGRILGDLEVWNQSLLTLTLDANQHDTLLEHLNHFIIMDDVELHEVCGTTALGLTGPGAPALLTALGLPAPAAMQSADALLDEMQVEVYRRHSAVVPHFELWVAEEEVGALWTRLQGAGARAAGVQALEALRIVEGIPAYGRDILATDLPQETSQIHALSFTKGCYLGQEIVERIHSRGSVHRHIRQFELRGGIPALPTAIFQDGKSIGELTSAIKVAIQGKEHVFALGHLRDEALLSQQPLEYEEGTATVVNTAPLL